MALPILVFFAAMAVSGLWDHGLDGAPAEANRYVVRSSDVDVSRAGQLLNRSQPSQALQLLRAALELHPRDPSILLLAGLAAHRSDQLREALGYWRQSLDLAPNVALHAMVEDANREAAADRSSDKLYGLHIALRYEGAALPADTARSILGTLEQDYSRISAELGCTTNERIVAIVQSREQYMRGTSAAEWSGGHFDGRIHVAWTVGTESGPPIGRALAHELVHACMASIPAGSSPWPNWLQEGLAQKLSGDTLQPPARERLHQLAVRHEIPRLENLGQDWFCMPKRDAVAAYDISLAAVDALYDGYPGDRIRNILANPETLPSITRDLDAQLGL